MKTTRTYQRPEVIEIGGAKAMTLGFVGCKDDGKQCEHYEIVETD